MLFISTDWLLSGVTLTNHGKGLPWTVVERVTILSLSLRQPRVDSWKLLQSEAILLDSVIRPEYISNWTPLAKLRASSFTPSTISRRFGCEACALYTLLPTVYFALESSKLQHGGQLPIRITVKWLVKSTGGSHIFAVGKLIRRICYMTCIYVFVNLYSTVTLLAVSFNYVDLKCRFCDEYPEITIFHQVDGY